MNRDHPDWILLNGYVDGALNDAQTLDLESRLRTDQRLREELERLRGLKAAMARMRPERQAPARKENWHRAAWPIAASVAILVVSLVFFLADKADGGWMQRAEALHKDFSARTYVVEMERPLPVVSTRHALEFPAPDLTASRLFLVDTSLSRTRKQEEIAMHYRGTRGCRLTIVAIQAAPGDGASSLPSTQDTLLRLWDLSGFHFAVIADGMDPGRFASAADYAQEAISEAARDLEDIRTAMADGYRTAKPCSIA